MPRTVGYFSLSGQFDPNEITAQMGIEPSWSHRIGDPGPPGAEGPRLGAEGCLACTSDEYGDVSDQIIALICKLRPKVATVAELSTKFDGTMNLVAYLNGNYPGFFLSASIVRDLALLQVDVDCEYIYASDDPIEEEKSGN